MMSGAQTLYAQYDPTNAYLYPHYIPGDGECNVNGTAASVSVPNSFTLDQRIAQTFIVGFNSSQADIAREVASKYKIGGVFILGGQGNDVFNSNFFEDLDSRVGVPLLTASDEEGGEIQRFREQIGAYPSAAELGGRTSAEIESIATELGTRLLERGINTDLAPVVDLALPGSDAVTGLNRGFSANPDEVIEKAGAFARGLRAAGVNPTYKHFPGLGSTAANTDFAVGQSPPIDELRASDLLPYEGLLNQNDAIVMVNNSLVPGITQPGEVFGTSRAGIDLLKQEYAFGGIITTDALNAVGVLETVGGLEVSVPASLTAGVTMPLFQYPGTDAGMQQIIDAVKNQNINVEQNLNQILSYKGADAVQTTGGLGSGSSVFIMGDSLTVGLAGESFAGAPLLSTFEAAGINVSGVQAVGGRQISWGSTAVDAGRAEIATSDAIVVGLGTNNIHEVIRPEGAGGGLVDGYQDRIRGRVQTVMDAIKAVNPDNNIAIYWTTTYPNGPNSVVEGNIWNLDLFRESINPIIIEVVEQNGGTIIPWGENDESVALLQNDNIHYTGDGYGVMAQFITDFVTGNGQVEQSGTSLSGNCSCSIVFTGGNFINSPAEANGAEVVPGVPAGTQQNADIIWGYFREKGLSPEATAAMLGNLEKESGLFPHNVQNNTGLPDNPLLENVIDEIRSSAGYGLAQWTYFNRQDNLITFAANDPAGRTTGDGNLQLDFIWEELSGAYDPVLTVLQTPGVTTFEATDRIARRYEGPDAIVNGTAAQAEAEVQERNSYAEAFLRFFNGSGGGSSSSGGAGSGAGCSSISGEVDPDSLDTSAQTCPVGTTDDGVQQGFRNGQEARIRICSVGGTRVNSQIAGAVLQMYEDARLAGVNLSGGAFRTMDGQIDIYNSWCSTAGRTPTPEPYPKASRTDYVSCPGGSPPGYSNHQMGFAIDIECNGQGLIAQDYSTATNNPCFQWLLANADNYGLREWGQGGDDSRARDGYEAWHWSIDGS